MPNAQPIGLGMGFAQLPAASKWALLGYGRKGGARSASAPRRRRRKAKAVARRTKKRASGGRRKSKLKFGSPAWQKKYKVGRFNKKRRK